MTSTERIAVGDSDMERFMRFVSMEPTSGCWLWMGGHNKAGYGMFWAQGRHRLPHRWIAAERFNQFPEVVMHKCDNPSCVNPRHLQHGTHLLNSLDASAKGRLHFKQRNGAHTQPDRRPRGERNGQARLTAAIVQRIRWDARLSGNFEEIGARHGVSRGLVSMIHRRRIWRHLEDEEGLPPQQWYRSGGRIYAQRVAACVAVMDEAGL